jgi:zinc/manganese transport system permease protein
MDIDFFIAPFRDYAFMRRALVSAVAIAVASGPAGVMLVQRRMSLMGEALSHGILPGIAVAYLFFGMSLPALGIGGTFAGLMIALFSYMVSKKTPLKEDASFSSFYLLALALGFFILSLKASNAHIMHLMFGNILAVDGASLVFVASTCSLTLVGFFLFYRPLVYDCFDALFMQSVRVPVSWYNAAFISMVVINLVAACQSLGTLMALGMMMIPAVTAKLLSSRLFSIFLMAISLGIFSSYGGLLLSFYLNWPASPTIILLAGVCYGMALFYRIAR